MPVVGEFHGKYWGRRSANVPIAPAPYPMNYPYWQAGATCQMAVFGVALPPTLTRFMAAARWYRAQWRLCERIRALNDEQFAVFDGALTHIEQGPLVTVNRQRRVLEIKRPEERINKSLRAVP